MHSRTLAGAQKGVGGVTYIALSHASI
jgi:hypothetical protein